jgi:hypothetical protein
MQPSDLVSDLVKAPLIGPALFPKDTVDAVHEKVKVYGHSFKPAVPRISTKKRTASDTTRAYGPSAKKFQIGALSWRQILQQRS